MSPGHRPSRRRSTTGGAACHLTVVSHKECWEVGGIVYSTGGFPAQMGAVSKLGSVRLVAPGVAPRASGTAMPDVEFVPLAQLRGSGWQRRVRTAAWTARVAPRVLTEIRRADLCYCLVPGDVGLLGVLLAMLARTPLLVRHCGTWRTARTPAERLLNRILDRTARTGVVLATGWADDPPLSHGGTVEWIFSSSYWKGQLEAVDAREGTPPALPEVRLVSAGRQVPAKGTPCCLRALPLLVDAGFDPALEVLGDGPALHDFERLATELGVRDRVEFSGRVPSDAVISHLRRSDVFVFPTTSNEGFPKVVGEAMACGLPVVSTPVSALAAIVPGAGELIGSDDPAELAAAIGQLVGDAERYRAASLAARRRAAEFTLDRWVLRVISLVRSRYPHLDVGPSSTRGEESA